VTFGSFARVGLAPIAATWFLGEITMRPLRATFASALLLLVLAACERPPDLIGVVNADVPVDAVPDITRHRIFVTTTREASDQVGALYSATRSSDLGLSSVVVTVPPTHTIGELERPTRLPPDPRTEFSVIEPIVYGTQDAFVRDINRELAARPPGQRSLLVFIHGYNTSTSDAVLRLGQFVEDSGFPGVPILFTWASAAQVPRYVYDLNSALVARVKQKEVAAILSRTRAEKVDILAHSMGTFLLMEGLVDAQLAGRINPGQRIDQIVLASPDIDIDLFRTQIGLLPQSVVDRISILVSKDDGALNISRRLAGGVDRVGAADADELDELGVTVIDLSQIEDSNSGSHSKFAGSPEVVQLIGAALNAGAEIDSGEAPPLERLIQDLPIRIFN
jgi:esterase/lipase superfamily enzyme